MDSDDYVASDLFDKLDELLYGGIDLLCLSTCLYHDEMQKYEYAGTRCIWMGSAGEGSSDSWTDFYRLLTGYMRNGALQTSSAKVFKLELIQRYSITFPEYLRIAEDAVFLFAYLLHIRSFRLDNYVAYYACTENPDSLSRGRREYLPEQLLRSSRDRLALLEASDLADADRQVLRDGVSWIYYRAVYSCAMELLKFDFSGRERRKQLRVICEEYRKKAPAPGNLKGRLIAFPVKWKLAGLIDLAARVRTRLRSENHRR